MRIQATLTIETRTDDDLPIEWARVDIAALNMVSVAVSRMGQGETEGTAHKAIDEALKMFRQINGIKTSEMTAGEQGYTPTEYSRHGLPGGIAAR